MKRIYLKTILCFLLLASMLLVSCGQTEPTTGEDTAIEATTSEETTTSQETKLSLVVNNMTDYVLIAPEIQGEGFAAALSSLRSAFADKYSLVGKGTLRQATDKTAAVAKEILVGETNRKESMDALASLKDDSYTVRVVNEKLVIIGTDVYRTMNAIEYFIKNYVTGGDSLILEGTFSVTKTVTGERLSLAEDADLRIMSWNVLGPSTDEEATWNETNWKEQSIWEKQLATVMYHMPDIIGFQECNQTIHETVLAKLYESYRIVSEYHSSIDPNNKIYCYTPILYNANRFTLKEGGVEWLRDRYEGTNTKSLSWAVLADKKNDNKLIAVVNFHGAVASNTYKGYGGWTDAQLDALETQWKKGNVAQLEEKITALEATYGTDMAVFIMGDYNANKSSEPYGMMMNYGYSDPVEVAVTSSMSGNKSTHTVGKMPTTGKPIDHILFAADRGVTAYVHAFATNPDALDSSDHVPVYVDFGYMS